MKLALIFLLFFSPLVAFELSPSLKDCYERILADQSLNEYIRSFPVKDYRTYSVNGLGWFYLDDIKDSIKDFLKQGIYWEGGIGMKLKEYTKPGTLALDLGSHIGIHSLTLSRCVGPHGLVISFEPQRKLYREQYYNLRLNGCAHNVVQLPFCVGEEEKFVQMDAWDGVNEGGTPIGKNGDDAYMITLDSLNLNNISCIKMDVESYELNVFRGAYQTIARCRPVIVFEILGGHNLDTCSGDILATYRATVSFLTDLGYRVERIANTNDFIGHP